MRIGYVIEHSLIEFRFFRFRFGFLVVVVKKLLFFLCEWHLAWGPFATLLYSLSYGVSLPFLSFLFVLLFVFKYTNTNKYKKFCWLLLYVVHLSFIAY